MDIQSCCCTLYFNHLGNLFISSSTTPVSPQSYEEGTFFPPWFFHFCSHYDTMMTNCFLNYSRCVQCCGHTASVGVSEWWYQAQTEDIYVTVITVRHLQPCFLNITSLTSPAVGTGMVQICFSGLSSHPKHKDTPLPTQTRTYKNISVIHKVGERQSLQKAMILILKQF